jgi:hypothetical protein
MVPIHDTDLAEERWSKSEWESYELWEKIEVRLRKRKLLWIVGAVVLFLALSSVPILIDRKPKWAGQGMARRLASVINQVKREASVAHQAYRLRLDGANTGGAGGIASHEYEISRSASCEGPSFQAVSRGSLARPGEEGVYGILTPEQGRELGIPGLTLELCYDPLKGSASSGSLAGIGVIPVNDLTEKRTDRISILLLNGPSAEITFD